MYYKYGIDNSGISGTLCTKNKLENLVKIYASCCSEPLVEVELDGTNLTPNSSIMTYYEYGGQLTNINFVDCGETDAPLTVVWTEACTSFVYMMEKKDRSKMVNE